MIARCAAALLLMLLACPPALAADEPDPDRKLLDRYEKTAKEMAARAKKQLAQIDADARALGERFAGEAVGKPFYKRGDERVCEQRGALTAMGDVPEPLPSTTVSRDEFDQWLADYRAEFREAEQFVDSRLSALLDTIGQTRATLDAYDKQGETFHLGAEWKARMHRDIMWGSGMKRGSGTSGSDAPNEFFMTAFHAVIEQYFRLIRLGLWEMQGGAQAYSVPAPPSLFCLILAEVSAREFAAQRPIALLWEQRKKAQTNDEEAAINAQITAATEKCAAGEIAQRDEAARRVRPLRDRYYADRERVRQKMLQWREEAVAAGPYDAADTADLSRVFGQPTAFDIENVAGFRYWALAKGASYGAASYGPMQWDWSYAVAISTACLGSGITGPLEVKYPDLEINSPFTLEVQALARRIVESVLPGADEQDSP